MSRNYKCISCGEVFSVDKETQYLINEGFIQMPDTCDYCASSLDHVEPDYFSDADPGL